MNICRNDQNPQKTPFNSDRENCWLLWCIMVFCWCSDPNSFTSGQSWSQLAKLTVAFMLNYRPIGSPPKWLFTPSRLKYSHRGMIIGNYVRISWGIHCIDEFNWWWKSPIPHSCALEFWLHKYAYKLWGRLFDTKKIPARDWYHSIINGFGVFSKKFGHQV